MLRTQIHDEYPTTQLHTHARQPQPLQGGLREEVLGVVGLNGGRFIDAIIDSFEASDARSAIRLFNALDAWLSYALSKLRPFGG